MMLDVGYGNCVSGHSVEGIFRSDTSDAKKQRQHLDDPETYKFLSSGDTSGVFMMEGKRMQKFLAKLKPSRIEDIFAAIALYRPWHPKKGVVK